MLYQHAKNIEVRSTQNYDYLYDPSSKMCHVINKTGIKIWNSMNVPIDVESLTKRLTPFSNPSSELYLKIEEFLKELMRFGLVKISDIKNSKSVNEEYG